MGQEPNSESDSEEERYSGKQPWESYNLEYLYGRWKHFSSVCDGLRDKNKELVEEVRVMKRDMRDYERIVREVNSLSEKVLSLKADINIKKKWSEETEGAGDQITERA